MQGYKVYFGTNSHNYSTEIGIGNPTRVNGLVVVKLTGFILYTTYCFSVTYYNDQILSSKLCPELSWTCQFRYDKDIFINPEFDQLTLNCFFTITEGYDAIDEFGKLYLSTYEFFEDLNFNQSKQFPPELFLPISYLLIAYSAAEKDC